MIRETFYRFHYNYEKAPVEFFLSRQELAHTIEEFEELSPEHRVFLELKDKIRQGDEEAVDVILKRILANVYIEEYTDYYMRRMGEKTPETVEEARQMLEDVNQRVHEQFTKAETGKRGFFVETETLFSDTDKRISCKEGRGRHTAETDLGCRGQQSPNI